MTVRSRRVTGGLVLAVGAGTLLYTVPSGRTLIVRGIAVDNSPAVIQTVSFYVEIPASSTCGVYKASYDAGQWRMVTFEDDLILNPGDRLRGISTAGTAKAMVFGSLLEGAPA